MNAAGESWSRGEAARLLRARKLVTKRATLAVLEGDRLPPVPIAVQMAIGLAAWGASALALLSIGVSLGWLGHAGGRGLAGGLLCLTAILVNRRRDHRLAPEPVQWFLDHVMLALGLTGFFLLAWALAEWRGHSLSVLWWPAALLATGLVALNPERMHRFLMTLAACLAWLLVLGDEFGGWVRSAVLVAVVVVLWLSQSRWSRAGLDRALVTVGTGLTVVLLVVVPGAGADLLAAFDQPSARIASEGGGGRHQELRWVIGVAVIGTALPVIRRRLADRVIEGWQWRDGGLVIAATVLASCWAIWRAPDLALCLLVWVLGLASGQRPIAALALVAMAVHLSLDYYAMDTTLTRKGLRLFEMAIAALLVPAALAWRKHGLARSEERLAAGVVGTADAATGPRPQKAASNDAVRGAMLPPVLAATGLVVIIVGYIGSIRSAEQVLRHGREVILELAPVDPRAFLTGDYMVLNLAVAGQLPPQGDDGLPLHDRYVVVRPDERGIARLVRTTDGPDAAGEDDVALLARHRPRGWRVGTDAYYFPEGQGLQYQSARYGHYRVSPRGEMLLTGLLDDKLLPLPLPRPDPGQTPADAARH